MNAKKEYKSSVSQANGVQDPRDIHAAKGAKAKSTRHPRDKG